MAAGSVPGRDLCRYIHGSKDPAATFATLSELRPSGLANLARAMPMQGHWDRVNTPLRKLTRRERNVAIGAVVLSLAAILAVILATAGNSEPKAGPGCIYAIIPGVMGAEPVDACGTQAQFVCAKHATGSAPGSETIRTACREAHIVVSPAIAKEARDPARIPHRSTSTGL